MGVNRPKRIGGNNRMVAWTREAAYWWPVLIGMAITMYVVLVGGSPHLATVLMGLADGRWLFPKIERFRRHGLDVTTAVELAAEQHDLDPEEVAVAHFSWLLNEPLEPHDEREVA